MELSELLRYQAAVARDAKDHGSSRKRKLWNSTTRNQLRSMASRGSVANEIAETLGYSPSSVRKVAKIRGIKLTKERDVL